MPRLPSTQPYTTQPVSAVPTHSRAVIFAPRWPRIRRLDRRGRSRCRSRLPMRVSCRRLWGQRAGKITRPRSTSTSAPGLLWAMAARHQVAGKLLFARQTMSLNPSIQAAQERLNSTRERALLPRCCPSATLNNQRSHHSTSGIVVRAVAIAPWKDFRQVRKRRFR
jgi:hypothetical protein